MHNYLFLITFLFSFYSPVLSQIDNNRLIDLIKELKEDSRGPYKDIRWFCTDGSTREAKNPCPDDGGFQRARYKDVITRLAEKDQIYLGQILKGNTFQEFYDLGNDHSKLKQFIIENYLKLNDDGWILRKAQYYRGAIQAEDEESWAREFILWLLNADQFESEKYYLIRETAKYIPHGTQTNSTEKIRALSKSISERVPSFMDLRTKIHGSPQIEDLSEVKKYLINKRGALTPKDNQDLQELVDLMQKYYDKSYAETLTAYAKKLSQDSELKSDIEQLIRSIKQGEKPEALFIRASDILSVIKNKILIKRSASSRLTHIDVSLEVESFALSQASEWQSKTLEDKLSKTCYLGQILNATGYTYDWEYEEILATYSQMPLDNISFEELLSYYKGVRRHINWGSALIETEFGDQVRKFANFESLTHGFIDDRIRSSALLPLGAEVSDLYSILVEEAGWENKVFDKATPSIQGINPGFAKGKLIIAREHDALIDPEAVYLFRNPPSDLEPVSGILSISEGNMVSHLQLLARNLGIPNANIDEELYNRFKDFEGKEIFYAVSNRGGVHISLAEAMTQEEKNLFKTKVIDEEVVTVPVAQMELTNSKVYTLDELQAASSGVVCGPKAANFAGLKQMFPDQLVDGFVISFAIFKDHMLQIIPDTKISYWGHLSETFSQVEQKRRNAVPELDIERFTSERLAELNELIKKMPLKERFVSELNQTFKKVFDKPIGEVPVFLRSDTNMEDLKDFTGAGLNLTVFNTIDKNDILQGIRNVWASPYSERSYKWRQKYLTNPQDVYPSILVIPSVFVDYSGVIITKDFLDGLPGRINLALSQGVGGAVDGQKAEAWILARNGYNMMVSPARDPNYKSLSKKGGTEKQRASLSDQMLTTKNIKDIWLIVQRIEQEMPDIGMMAPYDIELGFEGDKLWLFQIRPFVENKKANGSVYLSKLDPNIPIGKTIHLHEEL